MNESLVSDDVGPLRFILVRDEDVTGMSGTGFVAEGVCFWGGACAMRWRTDIRSTTIYDSVQDLLALHSHGGKSTIKWIDECTHEGQLVEVSELHEVRCGRCGEMAPTEEKHSVSNGWFFRRANSPDVVTTGDPSDL